MKFKSLLCLAAVLNVAAAAREEDVLKVYARGDYATVVKSLEPLYQAGSAKIQQRLLLARAYLHLDRTDDALGALRSVLKTDRENPEANSLTGRILHKAGKHAEAVEYLKQAYRLKRDPAIASTLGQCYYALGELPKAKARLEEALKEDAGDPRTSFALGKICLKRGLGALAEKYLLAAQEAGMDSPELHLLLGQAYLLQRKFVGPVIVRRIAGGAKPGDIVDGNVVLAKVEGAADQYKVCTRYSALYEGHVLLKARPGHPDALFMLARGWFAAGRTAEAEKELKTLAAAEAQSRRVLDLTAKVLLAKRDYRGLEECLNAAEAAKVFDERQVADFYYRAALIQRAEGKRAGALRLLKRAERRRPASEKVLRSLAGLCVATGRKEEARKYYARMVELFPDAPDIAALRNSLKLLEETTGGRR
ncbi:MAG: tetratricopeptide repeat protein [Planctomycetia bacterium]|nr:tetratricopeptide repeat protein [Planctomycetia bacterium]